MKILFPFIGDSIGGSHVSSVVLIRELIRLNIDVKIVVQESGKLESYIWDIGATPQFIEVPYKISKGDRFIIQLFKGVFNFFALRRILKKMDIDIVHTNDIRNHIQWMIASRFYCKHVLHLRTDIKNRNLWGFFFSQTEKVVAISDYLKFKVCEPKVSRIYNPIDFIEYNHEMEKSRIYDRLGFVDGSRNKILIGYIGRLEISKGIKQFLNVSTEFQDEVFIIAGSGSCEWMLGRGRVHHLGFVSDVPALLSAIDIVVLPSHSEGFGRVLIEAAMQGCAIIASDIPAHSEAAKSVRHCKFFPVGDDLECATQIRSCLEEIKMGCLRDNRAETHLFDPTSHAESILDVYKSIL